jgi:AcrR family transcriptional regulator
MSKAPAQTDKEQAKRLVILQSARGLLVERGFQDIALDDIARKAGVAKGTLFLYYKSKDILFTAAFSDLVDRLGVSLAAVKDSPLEGRALLDETARVVLEHFDANKDFMAQFGAGRFPGCKSSSCGKLMEKMVKNLDLVSAIVRRCEADHLVKTDDMDACASYLFGLCRSAILYNHMKNSSKPLAARRAQVVDMFLHGVGR